jgi:hypothetical protein
MLLLISEKLLRPIPGACNELMASGLLPVSLTQAEGAARADMDADDLFALMSALGWLVDPPSFAPRADHLFHLLRRRLAGGSPRFFRLRRMAPRRATRQQLHGTFFKG